MGGGVVPAKVEVGVAATVSASGGMVPARGEKLRGDVGGGGGEASVFLCAPPKGARILDHINRIHSLTRFSVFLRGKKALRRVELFFA